MTPWLPYRAERYLDLDEIEQWCEALAQEFPDLITLESMGTSRLGRRLDMLTIAAGSRPLEDRSILWLDAGTHASEWTSVSALLYSVSCWVEMWQQGDKALCAWLEAHAIIAVPCISPDGYDALRKGAPFLRSAMRPPRHDAPRFGLDPCDLDGDGAVRWMRWRHPAGPLVQDEDVPLFMRPRRLDDDPEDAYFMCAEGEFINWDGSSWTDAASLYGIDFNRNFPSNWKPFSMFGMDAGAYSASEPETRAVLDAFAKHTQIAAALTYHTYCGAILTQPYRQDTPLGRDDLVLMQKLADELVRDTSYDVYKVCPDFMYRIDRPIPGVWSDTMSTTFGVPSYTVEFWNPYAAAGVEVKQPAAFFTDPDPEIVKSLIAFASAPEHDPVAWTKFEHPQLGCVEIGGIDYMRTVRNPPEARLLKECEVGHTMAERLRHALPKLRLEPRVEQLSPDLWSIEVTIENLGYLPSSGLHHAVEIKASPPCVARVECGEGVEVMPQSPARAIEEFDHLAGWGDLLAGSAQHAVYPSLGDAHVRRTLRWIVRGAGAVHIHVHAGRAGRRTIPVTLSSPS